MRPEIDQRREARDVRVVSPRGAAASSRRARGILPFSLHRALETVAATLIVLGAAYLRFHRLGKPCLWLDEILNYDITAAAPSRPWYSWLVGFERENGPLYYATQWLALPLESRELAARLAPALIGVATVILIGLTARRLAGPLTGLVAILLAASSPLHVYYSREGRTYSLLMLFATTMVFAIARDGRSRTRLLSLAAFGAALTAASSFPLLVSLFIAAIVALFVFKRSRRGSISGVAIAGFAIVAVIVIYGRFDQIEASQYFEPMSASWFVRIANALTMTGLEHSKLERYALLPLSLAIAGAVRLYRVRLDAFVFVISLSVGVIVVSAVSLQLLGHWLSIRYISPALPAILILTAIGTGEVGRIISDGLSGLGRIISLAGATLAVMALLAAIVSRGVHASERESYTKADWRAVARIIWEQARGDQPVLCSNEWTRVSLTFYLNELPARVLTPRTVRSVEEAASLVIPARAAWLVEGGFESTPVSRWMSNFVPVATIRSSVETVEVRFYPDRASLVLKGLPRREIDAMVTEFTHARNRRLDFSAGEEKFLLSGFAGSERAQGDDFDFRWIEGTVARIALPIDVPRTAVVRMSFKPFSYSGGPGQAFQLVVNDVALDWRAMLDEWNDYDITVPQALWKPGINEVVIRLGRATRPSDVLPGSSDGRPLSASIDSLQILGPSR